MAQKNDNPADPFKKALAEATKVMADDVEPVEGDERNEDRFV